MSYRAQLLSHFYPFITEKQKFHGGLTLIARYFLFNSDELLEDSEVIEGAVWQNVSQKKRKNWCRFSFI